MIKVMEPVNGKPSFLRNIMVRVLLFGVLMILVRFAYVVTLRGESCDLGDFCFFSLPENMNIAGGVGGKLNAVSSIVVNDAVPVSTSGGGGAHRELWTSKDWIEAVRFYSSVFQDLIAEGYLLPSSKVLCIETPMGQDVFALKEIGVTDSIGVYKKKSPPLVVSGQANSLPFDDNTFDFVFSGGGGLDRVNHPYDVASEIARTLKPEGYFTVHTKSKDTYSLNSFFDLFNWCKLATSKDIDGFNSSMPFIREIVMKKEFDILDHQVIKQVGEDNKCSVPWYKQELVRNAEPIITEEPLKPWLTLKRNVQNIKYLPSIADINFKQHYVYVDVGARSYGSSIGSWFKKQYPKQNKTFEVYAIEADKTFYNEYASKKGITLLPYAAWVRNESLFFEINRDPGQLIQAKGRGMGRIKPVQSATSLVSDVDKIQGFDFANWLKSTVSEKDFVVMKMDVEGTEFDLIPKLIETGAICLVDEIFLECHYNRWQRCCPGERSAKYQKTYGQCLELFNSLRESGVLVHQWF